MQIANGASLLFVSFVVLCSSASLKDADTDVALFTDEIRNLANSGHESKKLAGFIDKLALPTELRNVDWRTLNGERSTFLCSICKTLAKSVISMRRDGVPIKKIQSTIVTMCVRLNLHTENVCRGIIELQTPIIFYIVDANLDINAIDFCGMALQSKSCSFTGDKYNWTIDIDERPPKSIEPGTNEEIFKIVHLTDIHYDPLYEPYGNPHCGEPMCCRKGQNVTNDSDQVAGYWGDYNECDVPWHSVVDALDHVKSTHQDSTYAYFTGDLIDHGVWETTQKGNIESIIKSYEKIKETFPNIPVYPIIGNHEPHPFNLFAPSYVKDEIFSTEWLYKLTADIWIKYGWLPESTRETILQGGFYTVSPRKGLRIIALNNNVCYTYNWWLIHEPNDLGGQLRWFADTLSKAEENNEYVHILAHVPPGDIECYSTWSREFRKIVIRYAHIISAQFNGHTHNDEFKLYYNTEKSVEAVNIAWNGGSITPFINLNPNYKVYEVEAKTFRVTDIDTWMFNLTAANETPDKRPSWYKSYSFREEYGLADLTTESLHKWVVKVSKNITELRQYRKNFYKHADPSVSLDCDDQCLRNHLCVILTSNAADRTQCDSIVPPL